MYISSIQPPRRSFPAFGSQPMTRASLAKTVQELTQALAAEGISTQTDPSLQIVVWTTDPQGPNIAVASNDYRQIVKAREAMARITNTPYTPSLADFTYQQAQVAVYHAADIAGSFT